MLGRHDTYGEGCWHCHVVEHVGLSYRIGAPPMEEEEEEQGGEEPDIVVDMAAQVRCKTGRRR
jgi:hypothetical protein